MGYNLYIGELQTELIAEPGDHVYTHYRVISVTDKENAPLNSSEFYSNECWPSYSGWADFSRRVGLFDIFFKKYEGILVQHPGAFILTQEALETFESAREKYLTYSSMYDPETVKWDHLRLDWLCYWTDWALKNCKTPAFVNS